MTDSMNFGPEWLRNLSSEGSTAGPTGVGTRYQLAEYRYGREEMLALFEKGPRAPSSVIPFSSLYSEQPLPPLALLPQADEEKVWQSRAVPPGGIIRGRGGSLERGGRISRGRPYQPYGRGGYDATGGWGGGGNETTEWSPRKDYNARASSVDNWRRNRGAEEDEGWRTSNHTRGGSIEKWGRSTSWRDGDASDERGPPERPNRSSWQEGMRGLPHRRPWDTEDHLPEWATENPSESGGSFDASGAFHGSDDEQRDHKTPHGNKREVPLQKSISQQNIVTKTHPVTLPSSQSAISLCKPPDDKVISEEKQKDFKATGDSKQIEMKHTEISKVDTRSSNKPVEYDKEQLQQPKKQNNIKPEHIAQNQPSDRQNDILHHLNNADLNGIQHTGANNRVEEEFERLQEDLVKKLVVDEETPKKLGLEGFAMSGAPGGSLAPPNLQPPGQDKWYYQDPQGDLQGPFLSSEMAEWFRAGYFTSPLLVKRLCDETFFRLGDLVNMCGGNPFLCNMRIAPLKQEVPAVSDGDMLQFQMLQRQLALRQAVNMRALNQPEPWGSMPGMQQVLSHQSHPQMPPDLQFLQQQQPATNPLMHMINQMQQANKLPGQSMGEKPPTPMPSQLDPIQALVQQMGGLQSMQNNLQSGPNTGHPTTNPSSLSGNLQNSGLSTNLQSVGFANNYTNMPLNSAGGLSGSGSLPVPVGLSVGGGIPGNGGMMVGNALSNSGGMHGGVNTGMSGGVLPGKVGLSVNDGLPGNGGMPVGLQSGLPSGLSDAGVLPPRPNPLGAVDSLSSSTDSNETLQTLLRQFANKQQTQQLDQLWQQNQYNSSQSKTQWHQQPHQQNDIPASMNTRWDSHPPPSVPSSLPLSDKHLPPLQDALQMQEERERLKKVKENQEKEQKRKREMEEKQAKKEAEERRKEEQRKQEAARRAAEEKRKKEEERIKMEMEKAKKEAEDKRLRELEDKRRAKEQRKAEEEARRKSDEQKKQEEVDRAKREAKEREDQARRQLEAARQESMSKMPRAAPWSQANSTPELSLADIQKAEREKRAEQAALLQLQRAQQVLQEQQHTITEKQSIQLNWANKPPEPRKVKSLAEIQQEEHERLTKQAAEARLAHQKEREASAAVVVPVPTTPWSGQNLSWANTASQWSNPTGFWDETSLQKSPNKPSSVSKSNSTSAVNVSKQPVKQSKSKTKKEEQVVMKLFSNGPAADEFTDWCTTALIKLNSTVDIPTFISFLRDIESALEVRDYCREYLGDGPTTQQFAAQFLEKRRMIKPKAAMQKDDMSSPAPAITPSLQHSTEFQEVKGKGKKMKKSKMTKIDARILGFSVTAAPDRLNVGDRDYVEN